MVNRIKKIPMPALSGPLTPKLLGLAIKAKRTQSGLRLEDAAALCGVAKQTLLRLEHGEGAPQLATILQVCEGLGIRLSIQPWQETSEVDDGWY